MKRSMFLTIGMLAIVLGPAGVFASRPNNVLKCESIVVDGNLGEWQNAEWVPLDQFYAGVHTFTSASFAMVWSDVKNKIYVAVKVQDDDHTTAPAYTYTAADTIEIYQHTTGTFICPAGDAGVNYGTYQASAQEFCIVQTPTSGTDIRFGSGPTDPVPSGMGITAVSHQGPNGWWYVEAEVTPWVFCGALMGPPKPADEQTELAPGVTVGIDAIAVDVDLAGGYKGHASENMLAGKYASYNQIATHTLSGTSLVLPSPIPTIEPTPTPTPGGTLIAINGNIIIEDYDPVDYAVPIGIKLVLFDDGWNILWSDNITLTGIGGEFSISPAVAAGTYNLAVKSYGHCATVVPCAIDGSTATELGDISLRGGDVHGDNEVFFTPLSIVLKYFGTSGDGDPF